MEKEKILWIILSVTMLVVIVLASGIYFLKPTKSDMASVTVGNATGLQNAGFDTYEYVRGKNEPPGLEPVKEKKPEEMTIVVGEKESSAGKGSNKSFESIVKEKKKSAGVAGSQSPRITQHVRKSKKRTGKRVEKRIVKKAKPEVLREYWIQAASYTSLAKAESLRDNLSLKGVTSRILTKEINGRIYYRVRLGPYKSKAEAEAFLAQIKRLKGFEKSYVSVVYVKK